MRVLVCECNAKACNFSVDWGMKKYFVVAVSKLRIRIRRKVLHSLVTRSVVLSLNVFWRIYKEILVIRTTIRATNFFLRLEDCFYISSGVRLNPYRLWFPRQLYHCRFLQTSASFFFIYITKIVVFIITTLAYPSWQSRYFDLTPTLLDLYFHCVFYL